MVTLLSGVACMKVYLCYIKLCMKVCLCYIIMKVYMPVILFTCMCVQMRLYNYTLYVYMQTCCWLQEVQVLGRCHALSHTFCNLFTLQLTWEKDVGMGCVRLTLCLSYPYTLFACFLALHPYIFRIYFILLTCLCDFLVVIV